jgi:membrane fusion protein (multidrug efflux system)
MQSVKRASYTKKRVIIPTITALAFIFFGIYILIYSQYYQSTDDAFVEGRIISICPKVSGTVEKLYVDDNQTVKKGQILAEIDARPYEYKLQEIDAKLKEAKADANMASDQISQAQSGLEQTLHENNSAESKLDFAQKDYTRYSSMYKVGLSSKQDYDSSSTGLNVASSNHKITKAKTKSAQASLRISQDQRAASLAEIQKLEAEKRQAILNLSYTKIIAPQSGNVTTRNLEEGNFVQATQPLLAIVPDKVWVIANFKETQLTHMKKGQIVEIKVDTYPRKVFKGRVDSIQRATGAKASLFPPENAVGSYVKIVQRVPVKIVFDEDYSSYNIVPGMSVVPKVKVR